MAEASFRYRNGNSSVLRPVPDDREICRYYLKGICRFGDNCWYRHNTLPNNSPTNRYPQNNKSSSRPLVFPNETAAMLPRDYFRPLNRSTFGFLHPTKPRDPSPKQVRIDELCVDFLNGKCTTDKCPYVHGDLCEMCLKACLNPYNSGQREKHTQACRKELVNYPPNVQLSKDKTCGICMDIIIEKDAILERQFGILENCNHVFCFPCIMKWRKVKSRPCDMDSTVDLTLAISCPECRTPSDFVTPSRYWFTSVDEKLKIIAAHRAVLNKKHCRFFRRGNGYCPFGGSCFHKHTLPNGQKVDLPLPTGQRNRIHRSSELGANNIMSRLLLLDFLDNEDHFMLENLMFLESESEFEDDEDEDGLSYISDGYFTMGSFDI